MTKEWTKCLISAANQNVQSLLGDMCIRVYISVVKLELSCFPGFGQGSGIILQVINLREQESEKRNREKNKENPCIQLIGVNIRNVAHLAELYAHGSQEST